MKKMKKRIISLAALLIAFAMPADTLIVQADAPYKTYTVDGYGYVSETQTAYLPYETITKVGEEALNAPTDFTLLNDGSMYILDSGNARVVVSDMEANLITTFGEGVLVNPRGIYVTPEHICYVADRDAKAVFVFDADGELIHTYGKPTAPLYGETQDFLPLKVIANEAGTMYIICESPIQTVLCRSARWTEERSLDTLVQTARTRLCGISFGDPFRQTRSGQNRAVIFRRRPIIWRSTKKV